MPQSPRRSLESLKKEAKRWLRELHAGDATALARLAAALPDRRPSEPTLREAQHALARELGFEGWSELKTEAEGTGKMPVLSIAQYEVMVEALLDAFRSGTPEAMERHYQHTWHRRSWPAMRSYVLLDLGRRPSDTAEISLDDARLLVANEHGFDDWSELTAYVTAPPAAGITLVKPMRANHTVSREWNQILEALDGADNITIDAQGQMTDALLRDLVRHPNVTGLNLGGSRGITDKGIAVLSRLPNLRQLDLNSTAVSEPGLEVLRDCDHLERLNLMWTRTGDGVIRALAGKARFASLTSGTQVTDAGLAALNSLPVFAEWRGGAVEMGLTSYEAGPNFLNLRGSFTDDGMAALRQLNGLFALNIDAGELGITARGLQHLVDLPHFGWLAADAKDDMMPVIAAMPRLRFLGCQDTIASDAAWVALGASRSIEYIWGRRCLGLRTAGFLALSRMPSIRALSVSCLNVEDRGIAALPSFPSLVELMPMDVPDAGYRHIGECSTLESLVLMYCRETTDAAMEHLRHLRNLRKYFVSYNLSTDRTPEILSGIDSLEEVTLDQCAGITDAGIQHLRRLPKLRKLRAAGPRITAAAGSGFAPTITVSIN